MSEATHSSTPPSQAAPSMTTESFQKYYGRGSAAGANNGVYPNPPHHGAERRHAPMDKHQHPHFAPPPNEPPSRGAPHHGYAHAPSSTWYYNQPPPPPPPPQHQFPSPHNHRDASSSKRRHAPLLQQSPPMVTPKESNDSDSVPNLQQAAAASKRKSTRSSAKQQQSRKHIHAPTTNTSSAKESAAAAAAVEEEIQVDPMKQDFFFYAKDRFDAVKDECEEEHKQSSPQAGNKENELYRLTTLMNARLIQDWESGPASLREQYMKMEDDDRQRFMSEEEVASRHCATLTARKRSPKQQSVPGKGQANARKDSSGDGLDGVVKESKKARL
eukprot:CAMPEP_0201722316 /NCGR_PEP_ID=MMETSP0593-20130828/6733_1 /ASSEMBLY_ACC=CAM_ASM_000672 /TAXON_ID=267983 /ORGANISM="Skeletonema japonicum, Strain CCMP2506" /LENGTH=328 /DNA_ID=CAMNT_0048213251 /DNA_START=122 /DNA_END=1108 /DNA_ORIENTATION=+